MNCVPHWRNSRPSATPSRPAAPVMSKTEMRAWALEQFARLDDMMTRTTVDLHDRQLVESFVRRIEIDPETKTGVVYIAPDLKDALDHISTRQPIGERMEKIEQLHVISIQQRTDQHHRIWLNDPSRSIRRRVAGQNARYG